MTDTIVSIITYFVVVLICYGIAWLLGLHIVEVVAFVALAGAVDSQVRLD